MGFDNHKTDDYLFAVLKAVFFPDILSTRYSDDESRADAVRKALSVAQTTDNQTTDKIP